MCILISHVFQRVHIAAHTTAEGQTASGVLHNLPQFYHICSSRCCFQAPAGTSGTAGTSPSLSAAGRLGAGAHRDDWCPSKEHACCLSSNKCEQLIIGMFFSVALGYARAQQRIFSSETCTYNHLKGFFEERSQKCCC